jgi:hypothetical protein
MNIYEKIDILCERIENLHEDLMSAYDLCNEEGIGQGLKIERHLDLERLNKTIETLKTMKKELFIEAGISLD